MMGLLGWIALFWVAGKMVPGLGDKPEGTPKLGGKTSKADGEIFKLADGSALLACAGKWWAVEQGGVCCRGASGTAVTLSDGEQVVCALVDELSSYRWVRPGSQ